ncbi:hypothetical protein [Leptolyngbya sp. FACHB-17]|nr:hypothetical protein [Leptolyngbya sp. FACHB-17]MBD2079580.1 hypothetical protein [Leptolyngbya sp. FACHB-17]
MELTDQFQEQLKKSIAEGLIEVAQKLERSQAAKQKRQDAAIVLALTQ